MAEAKPPDDEGRFMLRQLIIKNFVKFTEEQRLTFDRNGVYFLIGPNQTGKSSIFEAIRRCMSLNCQSSVSSAPNENEDSIVVCKFEKERDTIYSFYILKANTDIQQDKTNSVDQVKHRSSVIVKGCVLLDSENVVKEFGIDQIKYHDGEIDPHQISVSSTQVHDFPKQQQNASSTQEQDVSKQQTNVSSTQEQDVSKQQTNVSSTQEQDVSKQQTNVSSCINPKKKKKKKKKKDPKLQTNVSSTQEQDVSKQQPNVSSTQAQEFPDFFSLEALQAWITKKLDKRASDETDRSKSNCEVMLEKNLNNIVCSFPMRGFGPLQWSKSTNITRKKDNYAEASQRAEVLTWYLRDLREYKGGDKTNEQQLYNYITGTKNVRYEFDTDEPQNIMVKSPDDKPKPIALLKQSEGFVEAKLCSILLAISDFSTLLLEDPGQGMHPQMIDRLCTTMTEKVTNKVIIVSTHNSNFLKPWLMKNMFYFNKDSDNRFNVISGQDLANDLQSVIPNKITMEQFANFCYADTIVFVEGVSDQMFLEALARVLRKKDSKSSTRIQFVNMQGHGFTMAFRQCCKILKKRYAFVLDRDIWETKKDEIRKAIQNESKKREEKEKKEKVFFLKEKKKMHISKEELTHEEGMDNLTDQTANEIKNHFFVWKFQDLEAVFFHGVLEEYNDTSITKLIDDNKETIVKISYKIQIQIEGNKIEVRDINIHGVLKELEDKRFGLNDEMKTILENSFPNRLEFKEKGGDWIVSGIDKKPSKKKLFIHGNESFEDRVKLIEFLLEKENDIGGAKEISQLYKFLEELDNID